VASVNARFGRLEIVVDGMFHAGERVESFLLMIGKLTVPISSKLKLVNVIATKTLARCNKPLPSWARTTTEFVFTKPARGNKQ